jgi:hypothetical protein
LSSPAFKFRIYFGQPFRDYLISLFVIAVSDTSESDTMRITLFYEESQHILPISVGNWWKYRRIEGATGSGGIIDTVSVTIARVNTDGSRNWDYSSKLSYTFQVMSNDTVAVFYRPLGDAQSKKKCAKRRSRNYNPTPPSPCSPKLNPSQQTMVMMTTSTLKPNETFIIEFPIVLAIRGATILVYVHERFDDSHVDQARQLGLTGGIFDAFLIERLYQFQGNTYFNYAADIVPNVGIVFFTYGSDVDDGETWELAPIPLSFLVF